MNLCQRMLDNKEDTIKGTEKTSVDRLVGNEGLSDIASSHEEREKFKLSFEPNSKIPWTSNCLELKEDAEKGNYIIANKDLKVGDIILVEIKSNSSEFSDQRKFRCLNCSNFLHSHSFHVQAAHQV